MSSQSTTFALFEAEISAALVRASQLAREDAIKTNTGIIVERNGKTVKVSAAELKQQALIEKKAAKN